MAYAQNNCPWGVEREAKAKCLSLPQNMGDMATLVDIFEKSTLAIECDSAHIKALCAGQIVLNPLTRTPGGVTCFLVASVFLSLHFFLAPPQLITIIPSS